MPDHQERVELQFESRVPSRTDVAGIHHVLKMLSEVERRIQNIKRMSVAPMGVQGAQIASAAAQMDRLTAATQRANQAQANLARTVRTTFNRPGGGGTSEQHTVLGPGIRQIQKFSSIQPSDASLQSTKIVEDFEAQQKAARKAADAMAKIRQQEAAQRRVDRSFQQSRVQEQLDDQQKLIRGEMSMHSFLQRARQKADQDEAKRRDKVRSEQQKVYNQAEKEANKKPPRMPSEKRGPFFGFSPEGFVLNVAKVAQWASAVTVLYKAAELATYSVGRLIDVGQQTQRLSQVFSGIGGTAKELTNDVLGLAAANGQSTDAAMESAIAWSRLGLNRVEVNEAVRVSMVAANVAEMDSAQATKALSAIYVTYGLSVSELNGVLGMLNNTSNTFNVTNKELIDGLGRAASVAKQAGIGLAELQGLIGATVGRTGQSGSNIGNAIKTVLVRMNNPEVQDLMRNRFGVESTSGGGSDLKTGSEVLRELVVVWQGLNREEKANLAIKIAGATQANRFIGLMDSYLQGQRLAISAQENMNSAEIENAKVMASAKSQIGGLKAEWDKFIVGLGTGPMELITDGLMTFHGVLKLLSSDFTHAMLPLWLTKLLTFPSLPGLSQVFGGGAALYKMASGGNAKTEAMNQSANAFGAQAGSLEMRSNFLKTVGQSLSGSITKDTSLINQARGVFGPGFTELQGLVGDGNTEGAKGMLMERSKQFAEQAVGVRQKELDVKTELIRQIDEQISKEERGGHNAQNLNRLYEDRKNLTRDHLTLSEQLVQSEGEAFDAYQGNVQRNINLLGQQHALVQAISNLYEQMPVDTATDKLDVQIKKLQEEIRILSVTKNILDSQGGLDASNRSTQLYHEIQKKRGELAGAQSSKALAKEFDQREEYMRYERNRISGFGVGIDESERLTSTERGLRQSSSAHQRSAEVFKAAGSEVAARREMLAALADESRLHDLLIHKDELRVKLQTDLRNLMLEQKKQYAESLLMAGPGDLLRKLSVKQLTDRNGGSLGVGQFMGLSPQARQDYMDMTGGFRARELRRGISTLGPAFGIATETAAETALKRSRLIAGSEPNVGAQSMPNLMEAAYQAREALMLIPDAAAQAAAALREVAGAIGKGQPPSQLSHPIDTTVQGGFGRSGGGMSIIKTF